VGHEMTIYVVGNPDLPEDSLPLHILPQLQAAFPKITFETKDPNEEWDVSDELFMIDTIQGIKAVTVFHDLDQFERAPRVSMHDFDALAQLALLKKLGKLPPLTIIGVPAMLSVDQAVSQVSAHLSLLRSS
jgi:hypothetical protein